MATVAGTEILGISRLEEALARIDLAGWVEKDGSEARAYLPAFRLEDLGDPRFAQDLGLRFPCYSGAMANGIASTDIVEAMGKAGMLGVFGAAGLPPQQVNAAIDRLQSALGDRMPYAFNLIHSPNEPQLEAEIVELYLRRGVRLVEASAYLDLTPHVVKYRVSGIKRGPDGTIVTPNQVIAKISRVEVATKFLNPPPERMLAELVQRGDITADQADLARFIPMARDITAEADSGGHTDNQPALVLFPTIMTLRDRVQAARNYPIPPRIGAAGGIATPAAAAAAFAIGAAYIVTGSVNQACVESGTSPIVRKLLADARQGDIAMAPAADMFEMGVKVQVLKRGTMFPMRAAKLYEIFRAYDSLEAIPAAERTALEKTLFRAPLDDIWQQTAEFFRTRDPRQLERAAQEPKHRMALVFRWYLGLASHWANRGDASRVIDYQVWCGPAMAAFNEWVQGSFLEHPEERRVVTVAWNLLYHAAVLLRAAALRSQGVLLPPGVPKTAPLPLADLQARSLSS